MFRGLIAAAAAIGILGATAFAPPAAAADADQVVQVQNGEVRCLLSGNYKGRGYAMAICGRSDGGYFGASPMSTGKFPVRLNLAVVQGNGEMWWEDGQIPGTPDQDVVMGVGQTYRSNGWTVTTEGLRTAVKNDATGHGLFVNVVDVRQF